MVLPKRRSALARWVRIVAGCILIVVMLHWLELRLVYYPSREMDTKPTDLGRTCEDVYFKTADGVELNGWFFPADPNSPRAGLVFQVCHGNGGNVSHRLDFCRSLLSTGAAVFVFDYRGYGRSHGRPGEEGTYRDAQTAHAWLRGKGFHSENILAYGESLGGGVASELARRETVGGLVLQSTFTSLPAVGAELYPWLPARWISTIKYDTHAKLPQLKVPVLVMHSHTDDLIAFHHAEENFAAANEPKQFCELRGGHNEAVWEQTEFRAGIEKFLKLVEEATARLENVPNR